MSDATTTSNNDNCVGISSESNLMFCATGPDTRLPLPPNSHHSSFIQAIWCRYCEALDEWVWHHLLNRDDVYGRYCSPSNRKGGSKSYTAPAHEQLRSPGALTSGRIKRHFCGYNRGDLIGIHAISPVSTSRWLAIDIDQHEFYPGTAASVNMYAAGAWMFLLLNMGFHPLLLDSNGNGGLHLIVIFEEPVPTWVVHYFGQKLVANYKDLGLHEAPEIFPKQAGLTDSCRYGNWLRLPGLHHTRDHWTTVWNGETWLTAEAAIQCLTASTGDEVAPLREWLQQNPQMIDTTNERVPTASCESQGRPTVAMVQPPVQAVPAVPVRMASLLSLKTRQFLLGFFKNGPQWNSRLFAAACDMAGSGFTFDEALPQLLRGAVPYDTDEVTVATRTIESAFSQNRGAARSLLHGRKKGDTFVVGDIQVLLSPSSSLHESNTEEVEP